MAKKQDGGKLAAKENAKKPAKSAADEKAKKGGRPAKAK
jgi:hypothetical protein